MAQQEEGWPLGLQPLNTILGLMTNHHDFSGSMSFNTLLTFSPCSSTVFSSDLDTESTGSFIQEQSITLGSLMGVSSIVDLSGRSLGGRRSVESFRVINNNHNNNNNKMKTSTSNILKSKTRFFSLCSKPNDDHDTTSTSVIETVKRNPQSLAHFLEIERRSSAAAAASYRPNQRPFIYQSEPNGGGDDEYEFPIIFSCICGQPRD